MLSKFTLANAPSSEKTNEYRQKWKEEWLSNLNTTVLVALLSLLLQVL